MEMHKWLKELRESEQKKPLPILSFPSIQLLGTDVKTLLSDPNLYAQGMKAVANKVDACASVSYMDLSLEAETFGCTIKYADNEVPTVIGTFVENQEQADALQIPDLNSGRIPITIEGMKKAIEMIQDKPVFAGMIGPFSLAGRLLDVSRSLLYCKKNPELLQTVLEKVTKFQVKYGKALKEIGCNGVVLAEPLAGLLSPRLAEKFSEPYVKQIADELKSEDFIVIYHNCGNTAPKQIESILKTGCDAFHFGNASDMEFMLEHVPEKVIIMGNIDPASQFANGTPESIWQATTELLLKCSSYKNFVISSGCDIPLAANWDNIEAFFKATKEFYGKISIR